MEVSGGSAFSPQLHLSCEPGAWAVAVHSPEGSPHDMELTAQPAWSWGVTQCLPAEGDLAPLVLHKAAREPEPKKPFSLVPSFPMTAAILIPSPKEETVLGASSLACWGPGPCWGWARARAGLCESVGRLCGGAPGVLMGGVVGRGFMAALQGASPEERAGCQK